MVEKLNEELSQLELEVDPWFSLSELRWAPDGRKVLIPHARQNKPEATKVVSKECAFCPGSPSMGKTPYTLTDLVQGAKDRNVYFLENTFPTVSPPEISDDVVKFRREGIAYDRKIARGRHLVQIETPDHNLNPYLATRQYYKNLVWGYIAMLKTLRAEEHLWGGLGKNYNGINEDGTKAPSGASQEHLHSQAVGVDSLLLPNWLEHTIKHYHEPSIVVPRWLKYIVEKSKGLEIELKEDSFGRLLGECSSCIESRFIKGIREIKIAADDFHVSFVNTVPGSHHPYDFEINIIPYDHQGLFDEMSEHQAASFASILHQTMTWISSRFGKCGYNYELRQGPWKISDHAKLNEYYGKIFHWKFNVYPASSELGTLRNQGFMSHLLDIPIHKEAPENIARRIKQK